MTNTAVLGIRNPGAADPIGPLAIRAAARHCVMRWGHLRGSARLLAARIVRITDAFDAMTNRRPYQQPVSFEAALEELHANAGRDFDPELVRLYGDLLRTDADLRFRLTDLRLA